jgi:hypothetical protein
MKRECSASPVAAWCAELSLLTRAHCCLACSQDWGSGLSTSCNAEGHLGCCPVRLTACRAAGIPGGSFREMRTSKVKLTCSLRRQWSPRNDEIVTRA